jgi:SRSO17 transposase
MAAAGVPAEVGFATKPALAQAMISDALDAGVPASWVAADEVYGADSKLRRHLRQAGLGYVLAVAKNHRSPPDRAPSGDRPDGRLPIGRHHRPASRPASRPGR